MTTNCATIKANRSGKKTDCEISNLVHARDSSKKRNLIDILHENETKLKGTKERGHYANKVMLCRASSTQKHTSEMRFSRE